MSQIVWFHWCRIYIYILLLLGRSGLRNLAKTFRMCLAKLAKEKCGLPLTQQGDCGNAFVHPSICQSHFWGFHAFSGEPLGEFILNLMDAFIMGLPRPELPDYPLVSLCWIPAVSWPLIVRAGFTHLQINHWLNWAQIWQAKSLWDFQDLINIWSWSQYFQCFQEIWCPLKISCAVNHTTHRQVVAC